MGVKLSPYDSARLYKYKQLWNFYEGFHWEDIGDTDKPQITENYCRPFINKFVAYEFGKGFTIKLHPDLEQDVLPFLNDVWEDNDKENITRELGQIKAVTGEAWIQVLYIPKYAEVNGTRVLNPGFDDPFDEYDKGRIKLYVLSPNMVFPEYEGGYDKDSLKSVTVMYPIKAEPNNPNSVKMTVFRQVWYKDRCEEYKGNEKLRTIPNKLGIIPLVKVKNYILGGRQEGASDLEDVIPLNTEYNLKKSDVSEIIDYHSAPVTLVFGARIGQLEKGANKVWGGLPKDSKVENLNLTSDMKASNDFIQGTKTAMHEVANVPETALGKETSISNTSGVALQVTLSPLLERTVDKQALSKTALQKVNKIILKIGKDEGLVKVPDGATMRKFYQNEVIFADALPKDRLVEIQQLQLEMKLGLADRQEAMERLGKKEIQERLERIDRERREHPEIYGLETDPETGDLVVAGSSKKTGSTMEKPVGQNKEGNTAQVNSGLTNSPQKQQETNS
jgi:hypothetical protein